MGQTKIRDLPLGKPSVSESKNILVSWTLFFFSDEANFHCSGHVNKQKMRFWVQAQPHEHHYRLFSVEKWTVWCAFDRNAIIGPYWFEDPDGRPVAWTQSNALDKWEENSSWKKLFSRPNPFGLFSVGIPKIQDLYQHSPNYWCAQE